MKPLFKLFVVAVALFVASCGSKYQYETVPGDLLNTKIYTLDNGLKVYMSVNPDQPRIQTYIAVKVGAKNDPSETTGLAHYFEHLMFKGSEQFGTSDYASEKVLLDQIEKEFEVYRTLTDEAERAAAYKVIDSLSYEASKYSIPNEYDKLMAAIGAKGTNAYTSYDQTVYVEDIPSNQIDAWAKIQADRFKNNVRLCLQHCSLTTHTASRAYLVPRSTLRTLQSPISRTTIKSGMFQTTLQSVFQVILIPTKWLQQLRNIGETSSLMQT